MTRKDFKLVAELYVTLIKNKWIKKKDVDDAILDVSTELYIHYDKFNRKTFREYLLKRLKDEQ